MLSALLCNISSAAVLLGKYLKFLDHAKSMFCLIYSDKYILNFVFRYFFILLLSSVSGPQALYVNPDCTEWIQAWIGCISC